MCVPIEAETWIVSIPVRPVCILPVLETRVPRVVGSPSLLKLPRILYDSDPSGTFVTSVTTFSILKEFYVPLGLRPSLTTSSVFGSSVSLRTGRVLDVRTRSPYFVCSPRTVPPPVRPNVPEKSWEGEVLVVPVLEYPRSLSPPS